MEFAVKTRNKRTKKFVEDLTAELIKQLNLTSSKKFLLIDISKNAPGTGNEGVTMPLPGLDSYVIGIYPGRIESIGTTLAHEMVHVKQMARGQLKNKRGTNYWNGKKYSNKTKYLYSPWEVEAFSKQEILFRRALDKILKDIDTKR